MQVAELNIRGHIGKADNDSDEMEYFTESDLAVFLSANSTATHLTVNIESGGGYVESGFKMYDMLRSSGKVITTIARQADSIASVIFLAGDVRKVYDSAKPLIHFPFIENLFVEYATSDELENIHKGIRQLENKILNVYVDRTRANKEALSIIMERNQPIDASMFHALGFATEVIAGEAVSNFKALAKSININTDKMEKAEIKSGFEKLETLLNSVVNMFKAKVKALAVTLKDGVTVHVKTEAEIAATGDEVYMEEEFVTPAPDGAHELEDGTIIMTEAGKITEIILPVAKTDEEDMEALKTENANLKAEIENLKASKNELENKVSNFNKAKAANEVKLNEVVAEFESFKSMVLDSNKNQQELPKMSKAMRELEERRKARNLSIPKQ